MTTINTASRLRHRVTLQEPVLTPDGAGGYARSWSDVALLWAEIAPFEARDLQRERMQDLRQQSTVTHKVTLRYRDGVTAEMRLLHAGRALNIRAVINPLERGEVLELLVEEGMGD